MEISSEPIESTTRTAYGMCPKYQKYLIRLIKDRRKTTYWSICNDHVSNHQIKLKIDKHFFDFFRQIIADKIKREPSTHGPNKTWESYLARSCDAQISAEEATTKKCLGSVVLKTNKPHTRQFTSRELYGKFIASPRVHVRERCTRACNCCDHEEEINLTRKEKPQKYDFVLTPPQKELTSIQTSVGRTLTTHLLVSDTQRFSGYDDLVTDNDTRLYTKTGTCIQRFVYRETYMQKDDDNTFHRTVHQVKVDRFPIPTMMQQILIIDAQKRAELKNTDMVRCTTCIELQFSVYGDGLNYYNYFDEYYDVDKAFQCGDCYRSQMLF
jgi:hypothetical protein